MKKIVLFILLMAMTITQYGCIKDDSSQSNKEPIDEKEYNTFIKDLEDMNITVEERNINDIEHHILQGKPRWLDINKDEQIYVYLYENNKEMEKDISYLSEDGSTYDNNGGAVIFEWVYPPYYFKKSNIVALYVGKDEEIINALKKIFGQPF